MQKAFRFMIFTGGKKGGFFIKKLIEAGLHPVLVCSPDPYNVEEDNLVTGGIKILKRKIPAKLNINVTDSQFSAYFIAKKSGFSTWPAQKVNSREFERLIKRMKIDYIFIFGFPLLKDYIFKAPKYGTINCHSSILPKHRGANPEFWTIRKGDTITGISFSYIDKGIDTGNIIKQYKIALNGIENSQELSERVRLLGMRLFIRLIWRLKLGEKLGEGKKQEKGKYYEKPVQRKDRTINSDMRAVTIQKVIRASSNYSKARLYSQKREYKILDAIEVERKPSWRGRLKKDEFGNFYLRTKDNKLLYLITGR